MNNNTQRKIENLVGIADVIIKDPNVSITDFGIIKNQNTSDYKYGGKPSSDVFLKYAGLAGASAALAGGVATVSSGALAGMGLVAGSAAVAGSTAAAGGVSATGIPSSFIGKKIYDFIKNKINKNKEKERMYREIICKQQAAIQKQREINKQLEELLRESRAQNSRNEEDIQLLKLQINNLEEIIELLERAKEQVA